jgi:hypothetical protein
MHLNLAYRWFCRLGIEDVVPEHSTFSKNRHGRFREGDAWSASPIVAGHDRVAALIRDRQLKDGVSNATVNRALEVVRRI